MIAVKGIAMPRIAVRSVKPKGVINSITQKISWIDRTNDSATRINLNLNIKEKKKPKNIPREIPHTAKKKVFKTASQFLSTAEKSGVIRP